MKFIWRWNRTYSEKRSVNRKNINRNIKILKNEKSFKDEEHHLRNKLLRAFEDGIVARMRAKAKKWTSKKTTDALKILNIYRKNI